MDFNIIFFLVFVSVWVSFIAMHLIWIAYVFGWNPPPWMGAFMFRLWVPPRWFVAIILSLEIGFVILLFSGALRNLPNPFPEAAQ